MAGPEANFWAQIRRNMPKDCFATRIENRAGGGFPDVDMLLGGFPLKIELKISKNDRAFPITPSDRVAIQRITHTVVHRFS